jgi:hypothetical protein
MPATRSTAKKTTRKRAKSETVITTTSEFVRFPRPQRNNGEGNEEGPIVGIEVMLALNSIRKGSREIVYWTTDGKEGMTAYESLPQLIRERQLTINPLTMHRIHEAELKLRREAMGSKR